MFRSKREITPRTQEFLNLHKDAYNVALDGEVSDKASRDDSTGKLDLKYWIIQADHFVKFQDGSLIRMSKANGFMSTKAVFHTPVNFWRSS